MELRVVREREGLGFSGEGPAEERGRERGGEREKGESVRACEARV